jgi:hypothetical protein
LLHGEARVSAPLRAAGLPRARGGGRGSLCGALACARGLLPLWRSAASARTATPRCSWRRRGSWSARHPQHRPARSSSLFFFFPSGEQAQYSHKTCCSNPRQREGCPGRRFPVLPHDRARERPAFARPHPRQRRAEVPGSAGLWHCPPQGQRGASDRAEVPVEWHRPYAGFGWLGRYYDSTSLNLDAVPRTSRRCGVSFVFLLPTPAFLRSQDPAVVFTGFMILSPSRLPIQTPSCVRTTQSAIFRTRGDQLGEVFHFEKKLGHGMFGEVWQVSVNPEARRGLGVKRYSFVRGSGSCGVH